MRLRVSHYLSYRVARAGTPPSARSPERAERVEGEDVGRGAATRQDPHRLGVRNSWMYLRCSLERRGQTALILALVVAVGMTVAVSIAGRSVTTVSVGTQEEERSRSFSAAEAGVEDALRRNLSGLVGTSIPTIALGGSSVGYSVTQRQSLSTAIDPGTVISIDWEESSATSATVSWTTTTCTPTMVWTTITTTSGVTHQVDTTSPGQLIKGASGRLTRVRFVGCTTTVTLTGGNGGNLSFYLVDALGSSGEAKTRVQVTRAEPAAFGLLDFAVFSGGTIQ